MSSSASEGLLFFALVINGGLAGAIYALIALAFVLVYKASRMINFALGEWIMFGSLLTSTGSHTIGLDLGGAVLFGCFGMALLGVAFNAIVLGRLVMRPVISLIMVTLGLGALMRGVAALWDGDKRRDVTRASRGGCRFFSNGHWCRPTSGSHTQRPRNRGPFRPQPGNSLQRETPAGGSRIRTLSPALRKAAVPRRATQIPGRWTQRER